MDLSRPTVFFSAKVAIMKVKSATILFFSSHFLSSSSLSLFLLRVDRMLSTTGIGGECGMPLKESRCRNVI